MFICYDLVFETSPRPELRDFAFPTEWVNLPGQASANEAQRNWSATTSRVLLAANYGGFGRRSSGSGIWRDGLPLARFYNPTASGRSRLLVADVPPEKEARP